MVQQPSIRPALSADDDHHVVLSPTRSVAPVPAEPPEMSASGPGSDRQRRVRTYDVRGIAVVEASGQLSDIAEDLDLAIQLALADGPRGVICDLSAMPPETDQAAAEVLATAGRHVRDWPGIPVAVASPDPRVREAVRAQPLGPHLVVTTSLFSAVTAVLQTPVLDVRSRHLAPHPTAPRAARDFVTRILLDWNLGRVLPFASLVVSELVASSAVDAGTDIDLSVAWDQDALRLTIGDHGPSLPGQQPAPTDLVGRRLTLVAGLSRAFGVLPTRDGGKVVWAVLDAPRPTPSSDPHGTAAARQEALILQHARALAETPFSGDPRLHPTRNATVRAPRGALTLVR
jgi:hypothetical protein